VDFDPGNIDTGMATDMATDMDASMDTNMDNDTDTDVGHGQYTEMDTHMAPDTVTGHRL
jgi:hypothetical protein